MPTIGERLRGIFGERNGVLVRGTPESWALSEKSVLKPGHVIDISIAKPDMSGSLHFGCKVKSVFTFKAQDAKPDIIRKNIFGQVPVTFGPPLPEEINPEESITMLELDYESAMYVTPNTQPFHQRPDGYYSALRPI